MQVNRCFTGVTQCVRTTERKFRWSSVYVGQPASAVCRSSVVMYQASLQGGGFKAEIMLHLRPPRELFIWSGRAAASSHQVSLTMYSCTCSALSPKDVNHFCHRIYQIPEWSTDLCYLLIKLNALPFLPWRLGTQRFLESYFHSWSHLSGTVIFGFRIVFVLVWVCCA